MSNLDAAARLVADLRGLDRIPAGSGALIQMFLSLAEAVDGDRENASLWREYRSVESVVRGLSQGGESDAFDEWLRTQVQNTEDGPAHARAETRGDS